MNADDEIKNAHHAVRGITKEEQLHAEADVLAQYGDIIDAPHHRSKTHPSLSKAQRAAQFSPFAALNGYDEAIEETANRREAMMNETRGLADGEIVDAFDEP